MRRVSVAVIVISLCLLVPGFCATEPVFQSAAEDGIWNWYREGSDFSPRALLFHRYTPLRPDHTFLPVKPGLMLKAVELSIDLDSGSVRRTASVMGVEVEPPLSCPIQQYVSVMRRDKMMMLWKREARRGIKNVSEATRSGGLFSIDLPIQFPRAVQAVVGKGKPNLRVTGSEMISFSGQSNWTVGQQYSEYGKQSMFPRLDMRQDLVVKLDGTIGDKIDVDWDQSSAVRTELQNRIRIKYRGYDDEIIQSIDLGNTNLSIPNTQYVSYSGTHEGLFGIKSVAKLGSVDLTVIASKQEGKPDKQRIVGGARTVQTQVSDLDYRKRTYFFLDPPDFADAETLRIIDPTSIQIYIDDMNGYNDTSAVKNTKAYLYRADGTKDTTYFLGNFDVKLQEQGYFIDEGEQFYGPYFPILKVRNALPANHVLAVTYKEIVNGVERWVGNPNPQSLELKIIVPPTDELGLDITTGKWGPLSRYELRNVYYLGSEAIIQESFRLAIKKRGGGAGVDQEQLNEIPYIRILGLDQRGTTAGTAPDGLIDAEFVGNLSRGILFFPDLHPFAPDSFDLSGWIRWDRPDTLTGDETNTNIYQKKYPNYYTDTRYYLDVEYKSPQTTFNLGWNILENSEVVTLNGMMLQKGIGYAIDYDTGELVLLTPDALEPNAEVSVDFSRASLFGLSKTLLGVSSQYRPTDEISLGTTWLYESKGTSEERPRLEQEPSRTMVGGASVALKFAPDFMTDLVNALPLVKTREKSSLAISGELGLSIPNPNTRDEVYIDDMEGNRETRSLGLGRTQWRVSSLPEDPVLVVEPAGRRALFWYNLHPTYNEANVVHEGDLYPERSAEERERMITALELYVNKTQGAHGLTQSFSWFGEDFTEMQYIELWINDFGQDRDPTRVIRVDLGIVSEDAMWDPDSLPNGRLDTEDANRNGVLDLVPVDEDTGLDGIPDGAETCIAGVTEDPPDCKGDDYRYNPETAPTDFSHINGTEGNRMISAYPIPDTEDLDGDGTLDTSQNYFEFSVSLEDNSPYQVRDNFSLNGTHWRLFRIPISDTAAVSVGQPRWDNIKHVRLWLDGFAEGAKLQLASLEVVGNRWIITPIANQESFDQGERFYVGVINNKDNGDIYVPPIDPGEENRVTKREQSLVLTARNLFPADSVSAYKSFAGGNDYTQYRTLKFWLRGDSDSLTYFMRFGTDTLNFYEYATPVTTAWQSKEFRLEDLSILKAELPSTVIDTTVYTADGGWLRLRGRPSFTRVQRITMGLINVPGKTGSTMVASDSVWVDELRLTSVRKEIGTAKRIFIDTKFADLLSLSTQMESRDENFLAIGSSRGSGRRTDSYSVSGVMALHKFVPWAEFNIPVNFSLSDRKEVPKFRTGDDIILTKEYEEAQTTRNGMRSVGVSFRKSPSPNKWLRHTIESIGLGFAINDSYSSSVTRVDSTRSITGTVSYQFSPPGQPAIRIPFGRGRKLSLYLLPSSFSFSGRGTSSRAKSYERASDDPLRLIPRSDIQRKSGDFAFQTSYSPFTNVRCNYSINTARDWMLYNPSKLFGNIGTEVARNQSFRSEFTPKLGNWLTPSVNFNSSYTENHRPEITRTDDTHDVRSIGNSGNLGFGLAVPISRLAQLVGQKLGAHGDSTGSKADEGLKSLAGLVGKIGDIRASHSISYGAQYSRIYGKPNLSYMFGIRRVSGGNAELARDGVRTATIARTSSLAATGRLLKGVTLDSRFETTNRETEGLTGFRVEKRTTWPELRMGWSELESHLGLKEKVSSLRLDSTFRRTVEESGAKGKPSEKIITRSDWSPLVSLSASWKNGMRASFISHMSTIQTESRVGTGYMSKATNSTNTLNVQRTLDATKGFSLPFASGRTFKLKSSVNLGLTVQYSTANSAVPPLLSEKRDDLSVTSSATYSFSANLSGSFNFGFTQNRDLQIGVTRRGLRVGLSASFRF